MPCWQWHCIPQKPGYPWPGHAATVAIKSGHAFFAGCVSSATTGTGIGASSTLCLLAMEGIAALEAAAGAADADADAPAGYVAEGTSFDEYGADSADIARAMASSSSSVMDAA